jgi:hypothetical protein
MSGLVDDEDHRRVVNDRRDRPEISEIVEVLTPEIGASLTVRRPMAVPVRFWL